MYYSIHIYRNSDNSGCWWQRCWKIVIFEALRQSVTCGAQGAERSICGSRPGTSRVGSTRSYNNNQITFFSLRFTVPGCVSATVVSSNLLGPNFCHISSVSQRVTFNLGQINVGNCVESYLEAIRKLAKVGILHYLNLCVVKHRGIQI